jgi:hypothetical protein
MSLSKEGIRKFNPVSLEESVKRCYRIFKKRETIVVDRSKEAFFISDAAKVVVRDLERDGHKPIEILKALMDQTKLPPDEVEYLHGSTLHGKDWNVFCRNISVSIIQQETESKFPDYQDLENSRIKTLEQAPY